MPSDKAMQLANQYGCALPEFLAKQIDTHTAEALADTMRAVEPDGVGFANRFFAMVRDVYDSRMPPYDAVVSLYFKYAKADLYAAIAKLKEGR